LKTSCGSPAARPSGTNTQPWKVYVLQGASRDALNWPRTMCEAHDAICASNPELAARVSAKSMTITPTKWASPYIERRRENGWGLYGLLGIGKGDKRQDARATPAELHASSTRRWV
jgi:hypothetical protein